MYHVKKKPVVVEGSTYGKYGSIRGVHTLIVVEVEGVPECSGHLL